MPKLADAWKYAKPAMKYARPDQARRFAQHMVPHVIRPAQIIWNQAIGAIFLLLACGGFGSAAARKDNFSAVALGICFGAIMSYFGVASFLKARRLSRLTRL